MTDLVNHPPHYSKRVGYECIDICGLMDYNMGNIFKYLWRYPTKGNALEDLRKARKYVDFYLDQYLFQPLSAPRLVEAQGALIVYINDFFNPNGEREWAGEIPVIYPSEDYKYVQKIMLGLYELMDGESRDFNLYVLVGRLMYWIDCLIENEEARNA